MWNCVCTVHPNLSFSLKSTQITNTLVILIRQRLYPGLFNLSHNGHNGQGDW